MLSNSFSQQKENNIGFWFTDIKYLPSSKYTGALPYSANLQYGDKVKYGFC